MSANPVLTSSCNDVRASLGAYALGVVELDEQVSIEEHLTLCSACREALARELDAVGALALAVESVVPSADVRNRLLASVAATSFPLAPDRVSIDEARKSRDSIRLRRLFLPAMSVAAALLLIGAGVLGVLLNRALDDRDEARSAAQLLSTYVSSGGDVVTMTAQESSIYPYYKGQGSLLTAPGMEPVVVVAGCPESGDYLTYWVWFSRDGERTRAGKLTVGEDGSGWLTLEPDQPLSEFDMIGITVELEGETREDVLLAPLGDQPVNAG